MLSVVFRRYPSDFVDCEELEDLAKCKSHVARDCIMPNFEASKAEVGSSPLCSTPSEQWDGPALEMLVSMVVGRFRLVWSRW